jgi:transposase
MMGRQDEPQGKLFTVGFSLEKRVRKDHLLRRIAQTVDFEFIYDEVAGKYGHNGNVSVPPPVLLKLMLLLALYNVRSERELMGTLPERLDWLWFLGYDLDSEIPNHSVLSKARKRWGETVFRRVFERVVRRCVEAGLVAGDKIFVDSSLVAADASQESVVDTWSLEAQLSEKYQQLEKRLDECPSARRSGPHSEANARLMSATDPDAAIVRRGDSRLRYQGHRAVDASGVITATAVTPGDVNEAHLLLDLAQQHERTTGSELETVVADSKYGTAENYLACHDAGLKAHIPTLSTATKKRLGKRGLFLEDRFAYDETRDVYVCPAGRELRRRTVHKGRDMVEYMASRRDCQVCELRDQCTRSRTARTVMRHLREDELEAMRAAAKTRASKRDLKRRQHLCEASFGNATRYGFKRARWRRLWRVAIQDYLVCTVQNIDKLMRHLRRRESGAAAVAVRRTFGPVGVLSRLYAPLGSCFAALIAALAGRDPAIRRLLPALA